MSDLISRQAALYAIYGICNEPVAWLIRAAREIEKLPSVQPEPSEITDEQAILHLQSTGWMQNHDREMYESGLREQLADDSGAYDSLVSCEDAISRQAAIDFIDAGRFVNPNEPRWSDNEVVNFLKSRPSAQPEIIRCKDCKHAKITADGKYMKYCLQWDVDDALYLDSGFFCGHAERRTDSDGRD